MRCLVTRHGPRGTLQLRAQTRFAPPRQQILNQYPVEVAALARSACIPLLHKWNANAYQQRAYGSWSYRARVDAELKPHILLGDHHEAFVPLPVSLGDPWRRRTAARRCPYSRADPTGSASRLAPGSRRPRQRAAADGPGRRRPGRRPGGKPCVTAAAADHHPADVSARAGAGGPRRLYRPVRLLPWP